MEIGVDSFAAILPDPQTGKLPSATERMAELIEEVEVADRVGLDVFGIGEHHREEFQFDEMVSPDGAYLIGSPATVAAKMLRASEALGGVLRTIFQKSTASVEAAAMKRSIELLGTEVAPIVRAARRKSAGASDLRTGPT